MRIVDALGAWPGLAAARAAAPLAGAAGQPADRHHQSVPCLPVAARHCRKANRQAI